MKDPNEGVPLDYQGPHCELCSTRVHLENEGIVVSADGKRFVCPECVQKMSVEFVPIRKDGAIPIFNARIISYEPVTVMEFNVGGDEWVRYVPATEIQEWLYSRMRVFQA